MHRAATICSGLIFSILATTPFAAAQDLTALKETARALFKSGNYTQAITAYEQALAVAERTYPAGDQKIDIVINELAMSLYKQGRLTEAGAQFLRVLKNTERRNPNDPEVATCLGNLGAVYDDAGDYRQAEALYLRAYAINAAKYGPNDPNLATSLNNLGAVYSNLRDDVKAVSYYKAALALYERESPRNEVLIANALHNLAGRYSALGQLKEADDHYRLALKLREAKLGPEHPSVATTLNSLAAVKKELQKPAEAEALYRRSLELRQARLGKDHPDVATSLSNLGVLYSSLRRYEDAEAMHQQALAIREKKLEPDHPSTAITLNNLAVVYQNLNQDAKAEELFAKALKIRLAKYGPVHPEVAQAYKNSALLQAKLDHWDRAAEELDKTRRIVREHARRILPALSETEQLTFLKVTDEDYLHIALSLGLTQSNNQTIVNSSAEWLLNAKGIVQQTLAQKERLTRDLKNPKVAQEIQQLQAVRGELAYLQRAGGKFADAERTARREQLQKQEAQLFAAISAAIGGTGDELAWVKVDDVRKALKAGDVLIEIARFRVRNFALKTPDGERWLPTRYVAWVIPAAEAGEVTLVDLGPAAAMEIAVSKARQALEQAPKVIQARGDVEADQELRPAMQELTKLLLDPLAPHLGKAQGLRLSPDAALWLVPWAALPIDESRFAIEKYALSYLVSGRDLLSGATAANQSAPIIFADPDYNLGVSGTLESIKAVFQKISPPKPSHERPAVQLGKAEPLPATAVEAQLITSNVESVAGKSPNVYQGRYALEGLMRFAHGPKLLVLSTHGFFLASQELRQEESDTGRSSLLDAGGKPLENPLLRCGLLLAGCNTRELANRPDADDGVLTGKEIVGIDLRGTELVVLSACQTGLGEVRSGEGVAGLRQAFQLAGAQSVLATLWEIPDAQSAKLMNDFFAGLAAGKARPEALRSAQLALIESRRERRGAAHPFFWAAFTITGAK